MSWECEVEHKELNKYRVVRGKTKHEVEQKAHVLQTQWNELEGSAKTAFNYTFYGF